MIDAKILGGPEVTKWLYDMYPKLRTSQDMSIVRITLKLMRKVKADKLSGQVLNVRTGRLRRSITTRFERPDASTASGYVGTNVKYARAHEFGFNGTVTVKAHLRMQKKAWGRDMKNPHQVQVKAHTMKMNIPEKSFLRSALREMQPEIMRDLNEAITQVIRNNRA